MYRRLLLLYCSLVFVRLQFENKIQNRIVYIVLVECSVCIYTQYTFVRLLCMNCEVSKATTRTADIILCFAAKKTGEIDGFFQKRILSHKMSVCVEFNVYFD